MPHTYPTQMTKQSNQIALGDRLYLFKSETTSHRAMITAHGGYWRGTGKFTVPKGVTIKFYSAHGHALANPGLSFLKSAKQLPAWTVHENEECFNYSLSKFQGRHGSQTETYQAISGTVKTGDKVFNDYQKTVYKNLEDDNESMLDFSLDMILRQNNAHVVTIRNRRFKFDVTLKEVIDTVRKHYPEVTEFHCSHCRSKFGL